MRKPIEVICYQATAPDHHHQHPQIVVPLSGQLALQVEGQQALLKKGQACLISKDYKHTHFARHSNRCLVINSLPSWDEQIASKSPFVSLSASAQRYGEFLGELSSSPQHHAMLPQALAMFEQLLPLPMDRIDHQDRRLKQAKALLDEHFAYPWSIPELASKVHLSQSQLSVLFKRFIGLTPKQYLRKKRLEKAQYYLCSSQLSLEKIANQVGLSDANALIRLFQQHLHITPRQYQLRQTSPAQND